jgi:integrase
MTSPRSREIVLAAAEGRPTGLSPAELGLAAPTINRHVTALRVIHRWAGVSGLAVPMWSFEHLHIGVSKTKRDRNQRPPTSLEDLKKLFALPIFTGCQRHRGGTGQTVLRARFTPGPAIIHDAFYWVPLLIYYTGARREEICKLQPNDFRELDGIAFIQIDETETGRVKNHGSVRAIPLHSELIRLGLIDFVEHCRCRGQDVLFPELRPTNKVQKYGDVFYKRVWVNIRAKGGLSPRADIHGTRHRFSTALKGPEGRERIQGRPPRPRRQDNHRGALQRSGGADAVEGGGRPIAFADGSSGGSGVSATLVATLQTARNRTCSMSRALPFAAARMPSKSRKLLIYLNMPELALGNAAGSVIVRAE